ncbi:flavin-containing monooxygenase [Actinomycetospora straminea]|uniref:NAD(P)/FAD-dependent oxidoreductase n=1 Tax=Actinomycetospora straminea TaxID=663607 RepID=A0ABP9EC74_9PSEU|nr:NAD(P)/FAD-dependent oxidoreductase [Actinomycetospora straminea]MDD7932239.1 NAD(P)/FAD-dependent oxidoreductase [Actinomycetospora straminea]
MATPTVPTAPSGVPDELAALLADDDALAAAVDAAEMPALLPALAHLTGELDLVDDALRPPLRLLPDRVEPQGGMAPEVVAAARERALAALRRFRDSGMVAAPEPATATLRRLMRFVAGDVGDEYLPLMAHELGLPDDVGAPGWTVDEVAPGRTLDVVVVGAGMSGLVTAHRLTQAGVGVTVLERNDDVGGVWLENGYPGARLDTANFAYSYSFAQRPDWPHQFSARDDIHDYFRSVADAFDLRRLVRFGHEVVAAEYDDATARWTVTARDRDGTEVVLDADAVISATGQLNRPKLPDVPGRDSFAGPAFHTARWRHDVDLTGRRVAVIGTGASAYQVVPSIVDRVASLTVFQRTPPWMAPTPTYHAPIPEPARALARALPHYPRWLRFLQFWTSVDGRRPFMEVDPDWDHPVSVSARNEALRRALVANLEARFGDRPDLLAKVVPDYPPGAKRMMRDNGVWAAALHREHVALVTDAITEVTPTGVRTADGAEHQVDVVVYATGFHAEEFLAPITVRGREGRDLHAQWGGDARAHLGVHVPGFPNLFCVYGPNTGLVINGSILLFSEIAVHHVLGLLRELLERDAAAVEVRPEAHDAYNARVDAGSARMAWGVATVNSWYRNAAGRVSQVWPFPLLDYWRMVREPDLAEYAFHPRRSAEQNARA